MLNRDLSCYSRFSMLHQNRQALVVEGGGMRGAFTSGVLDAFLQQQFNPFDLCVGVSSGSTNVANYLAAQQHDVSKLMVLRTRPKNYYKASSKGDQLLAKYVFKQKRGFAQSLLNRTQRYNDSVQFVRSASKQQILEVCPPDLKNMAGRLSKNKAKICYSYDVGIETGLKAIEDWKNL